MTDRYATWDAAYVLGALTPTERQEYTEHLSTCADCTRAVGELAGIPGMLALIPREEALLLVDRPAEREQVPSLLPKLAERTQRRRRRNLLLGVGAAVAAAAAAVAIAIPIARTVEPAPGPDTAVVAVRPMEQTTPSPITADVELARDPAGTRVTMDCRYEPGAYNYGERDYALWVTGTGGKQLLLMTWPAGPGAVTRMTAIAPLPPEQIRGFDIRAVEGNKVLLIATL